MIGLQHFKSLAGLILLIQFSACVSASKYKKELVRNQESQLQLSQLEQIRNQRDSLAKELEMSARNLLKTEKTLTEFYIRYRTQENTDVVSPSSNSPEPTARIKILEDSLRQSQINLEGKIKELTELNKKHQVQEDKYHDQDKRLSDLFSALYKQRTAFDSLQNEYYALHKSKNQNSNSNKIDPEENKKLKKSAASKDSLIFKQQKSLEEKSFQIAFLKNKLDSTDKVNRDLLSHAEDQSKRVEENLKADSIGQLKIALSSMENRMKEVETELENKNLEIQNYRKESDRIKKDQTSNKSDQKKIKMLEEENQKLLALQSQHKIQIDSLIKSQTNIQISDQALVQKLNAKVDSMQKAQQNFQHSEQVTVQKLNRKLDSMNLSLVQKEQQIQDQEKYIKLLESEKKLASTKLPNPDKPAAIPRNLTKGKSVIDKLNKIEGIENIQMDSLTGVISFQWPQSILFTSDLITLTQNGSELVIKIAQNLQGNVFKSVELTAVQDASKSRNDQIELMFGRAKAMGKLMNIYGVKSDNFSFGLQPTGDKENIRISLSLK
ncbi:MAG: hypothetical protein IPM48_07585 [Saprospiraceae bacterium]|nr:hypothetical protein [Saprospiraceae bacterium]